MLPMRIAMTMNCICIMRKYSSYRPTHLRRSTHEKIDKLSLICSVFINEFHKSIISEDLWQVVIRFFIERILSIQRHYWYGRNVFNNTHRQMLKLPSSFSEFENISIASSTSTNTIKLKNKLHIPH